MKTKKMGNKLALNKATVTNLSSPQLAGVKGGCDCTCCDTCDTCFTDCGATCFTCDTCGPACPLDTLRQCPMTPVLVCP